MSKLSLREKELMKRPKLTLVKLLLQAEADNSDYQQELHAANNAAIQTKKTAESIAKQQQEDKEITLISQKGQTIQAMAMCMEAMARSLLNQPYGGGR